MPATVVLGSWHSSSDTRNALENADGGEVDAELVIVKRGGQKPGKESREEDQGRPLLNGWDFRIAATIASIVHGTRQDRKSLMLMRSANGNISHQAGV